VYEGGQVLHVAEMLQGFPVMVALNRRFMRLVAFPGYLLVNGLIGNGAHGNGHCGCILRPQVGTGPLLQCLRCAGMTKGSHSFCQASYFKSFT
jgi:hypothetical protein